MFIINYFEEHTQAYPKAVSLIECVHQNSLILFSLFFAQDEITPELRVTLVITESLARTVLPLSTNAFYGQLVSLNAAFFRVWRLTRRICLLDHLSFASLAGYSRSLNPYAFFPINQFSLASLPEPHSLASVVLSTFKHIPEQTFAFIVQYRS